MKMTGKVLILGLLVLAISLLGCAEAGQINASCDNIAANYGEPYAETCVQPSNSALATAAQIANEPVPEFTSAVGIRCEPAGFNLIGLKWNITVPKLEECSTGYEGCVLSADGLTATCVANDNETGSPVSDNCATPGDGDGDGNDCDPGESWAGCPECPIPEM